MSRRALLLAAAPAVGCEPATSEGPTPPELDPVERRSLLLWALSDPASTGGDAADTVAELRPSGILVGGDAAATLDGVPTADSPTGQLLAWAAGLDPSLGLSLAIETALLPGAPTEACFDPADPTADPAVAALRDQLGALLDAWPAVTDVMPDPLASAAYWDVACTCTPCDGLDAAGMASRHDVLWDVAWTEVAQRQRQTWWWHRAPDTVTAGAPEATPLLPRQALDLALSGVDDTVPVRAAAGRGTGGPWAPNDPIIRDVDRLVVGSLDVAGAAWGPTDALLLQAPDLYAQMREERAWGITAWVAAVDGNGRSALGALEEADLRVVERAYRDPGADPNELLGDVLATRFGLVEEDGDALARTLIDSGHALALATHPLGIPIRGVGGPIPGALPLEYEDPSAFDGTWADRVALLATPDLSTLAQANQWATEAALTASLGLGTLNQLDEDMDPADVALLRRRLRTTDYAARAWGRIALADVTLRAHEQGFDAGRTAGWLAEDAVTLAFLADEVDTALADGAILDAYPVVPANLRAIADQITAVVGAAEPVERDFPVLYRSRHDFLDGRINYYWTVTPPGNGWVERGTAWPVYDDMSSVGEDTATWWHAWTTGVPSDTKVVWRPCTESESGLVVCGSDRVLWTPF